MIADPNRHVEQETLQALLDESLSSDQVASVESHLSDCDGCRDQLESLAGGPGWWNETVNVLSDSTLGPASASSSEPANPEPSDAIDASIDWIRPLLDPSPDGGLGSIDQYPVSDVIGQGGMGVVLRANDSELHRPLAIKILSPHLAGVGAARTRFMREAQAAAAIVHPSIVPIYSIANSARLPYIVMPWIGGGNLQERIDREGPLELIEILRISLQIAEGLAAAHRHVVIHRDIKPANILIEEGNGRVLISDFGLARALDDATLTMSGMIAGTPQYMSPEQARGDVVDARSDLFSLGSLMYALATGRPPFRAESPLAVLRKISDSRPRPARVINERIPEWLDRIIARFMEVDRNKRVQSADEAVELLRESLNHARNPSAAKLPKSVTGNRPVLKRLAVAGSIVVIAAGLGVLARNGTGDRQTIRQATGNDTARVVQSGTPGRLIDADAAQVADWHGNHVQSELGTINAQLNQLQDAIDDSSAHQIDQHNASDLRVPQSGGEPK